MLLLIALLILPIAFDTSAIAAEKPENTVKVGFFAFDGYHNQDEHGNKSGYGYEYLQQMARYEGWNYEYVGYEGSWSDAQKMLETGQIDLLTSAQKTEEREKKFDFSDHPIGYSSTIFTIKAGNEKYSIDNLKSFQGIQVGMIEGNSRNEEFDAFAREKGFQYKPVMFDDMDNMVAGLQNGSIDAAVTSSLRVTNGEWVVAQFGYSPYYVCVKKGNHKLLEQVNDAIDKINQYNPGLQNELEKKYYSVDSGEQVAFTEEERNYIQQLKKENKKLKVMVNPDRAPLSYYEKDEIYGILGETTKKILELSGLPYEIIKAEDRAEYETAKEQHTIDLCLDMRMDYNMAENLSYRITDSYYSANISRIMRSNSDGSIHTIAAIENSDVASKLQELVYKDAEITYYETGNQCVEAVKSGKQDATFLYTYVAEKYLREDIAHKLSASLVPDFATKFCIGIENNTDTILFSILNKSVNSIDEIWKDHKTTDYISNEREDISLQYILYNKPELIIFVLVLFFVLIGIICIMLFWQSVRKKDAEREREERKKEEESRKILEDALKVAEEASKAKGTFMSRMSHEIRTPLNAVIGYMDIAKDSEDNPDKMMHCIENSGMAAKHLLSIINDVLDISSIESGRMKIAKEEFDLKRQLTSISTIFFNQAKNKKVKFDVHLEHVTQEWVIGDSLRLNQILMNLLSNAVKFTPEDGVVSLTVTQVNIDDVTVYMKFTVKDTGIGMSEAYQRKLFQPFEQESALTAQKYGGTGLGLSITNNLIHMMGGSIDVKSKQGEGSTFVVSLHFERSKRVGENIQHDYSHVRALVVDDDKASCEYMQSLLKRCHVKCDTVNDGNAALKQIKRRADSEYKYDLCIMDWNMPEMNGIETARRIKEECHTEIPIIIATAYDITEFEDQAKQIGIDKIIAKPLFQSTMFDLLVSTYGKYEPIEEKEKNYESIKGLKILLAEDNPMNQEIAIDILTKAGMVVEAVSDGKQAYDAFVNSPEGTFDVILMDIQMPVMDGYQATGEIRRSNHKEAQTIPIIAMTANAFVEDVNAALASGMNGHIAKPVDYGKLYTVLSNYAKN